MAKSFEELLNGAEQIRTNELPESNTAALVGGFLVDFVNKVKGVKDDIDDTIGDVQNNIESNEKTHEEQNKTLSEAIAAIAVDLGSFSSVADFKLKIDSLYSYTNIGRYFGIVDLLAYKFPFVLQVSSWHTYTFQSLLINCSLDDLNNDVTAFSSSGDRLFVRRFSGSNAESWIDEKADLSAVLSEVKKDITDAKGAMATKDWVKEQKYLSSGAVFEQNIVPGVENLPPDAEESVYSIGENSKLKRWLAIYVKEVVAETIGRLDRKLTIQAIDLLLNADGWIQCLQNLRFGKNYNSTDEPKYGIDVGGDANFQSVSIKGSPIIQSVYLTAEEYQNLVNNGEVKEDVEYNIYE